MWDPCHYLKSLVDARGSRGRLPNGKSRDDLAVAMKTLANDEKMREDLSVKGRARASLFSWERVAQETFELYEEVVAK